MKIVLWKCFGKYGNCIYICILGGHSHPFKKKNMWQPGKPKNKMKKPSPIMGCSTRAWPSASCTCYWRFGDAGATIQLSEATRQKVRIHSGSIGKDGKIMRCQMLSNQNYGLKMSEKVVHQK